MKWALAMLSIAVAPIYFFFTWLTDGRFLPTLAADPDEFNIQQVPLMTILVIISALALHAWRKLRPAKVLLVAVGWNLILFAFLLHTTITMWGEH